MKRATAAQDISLDGDDTVDDQLHSTFAEGRTPSSASEEEEKWVVWTGHFNGGCRLTTPIKTRSRGRTDDLAFFSALSSPSIVLSSRGGGLVIAGKNAMIMCVAGGGFGWTSMRQRKTSGVHTTNGNDTNGADATDGNRSESRKDGRESNTAVEN
jgi:hypothetical protein